jgi:hypothetical protein
VKQRRLSIIQTIPVRLDSVTGDKRLKEMTSSSSSSSSSSDSDREEGHDADGGDNELELMVQPGVYILT